MTFNKKRMLFRFNRAFLLVVIVALFAITVEGAYANIVEMNNYIQNYLAFEDSTTPYYDNVSSNGWTSVAAPITGRGGIIDNAYEFVGGSGDNDIIENADTISSQSDWSYSVWVNLTDLDNGVVVTDTDEYMGSCFSNGTFGFCDVGEADKFSCRNYDGNSDKVFALNTSVVGEWYHLVCAKETGYLHMWLNGIYQGNVSSGDTQSTSGTLVIGNREHPSLQEPIDAIIDEFSYFNGYKLSGDDVAFLYGNGAPSKNQQYPFSAVQNLTISVYDYYDNSSVNGVNVTIDGTTYENATGNTVEVDVLNNDTSKYDINVTGSDHFDGKFFNVSPTVNNYRAYLKQSEIIFQAYNLVFNNTITANYTLNGTQDTVFYPSAGEYTVLVEADNYYSVNHTFNVSALDNITIPIYGLYTTRLTISPRDILNNNTIDNATISLVAGSFNATTINITDVTLNATIGSYNLTITAPNRSSYSENFTLSNSGVYTHYAYMYAYNSLWVYAFDQDTGNNITTFSVTVENDNNSYSDTTSDGRVEINNIISGVYTVTVSATNYTSANYVLTMTDASHQEITAFLTTETADTLTFTFKDRNTNEPIVGASAVQRRFINGTPQTIASETSDIAGLVQFSYLPAVEYDFIISKDGYETRNFSLEPIISAYTVLLTPLTTYNASLTNDDVVVSIGDYSFMDNYNSYVVVDISSGTGSLESYSVTLNSTVNNTVTSGSNAVGESINASMLTNGTTFGDRVTVTITYKSTLNANEVTLQYIYAIDTFTPGEGSLVKIREELGSLGDLQKAILGTILVAIFTAIIGFGASSVGEGATGGAIGALFGFAIVGLIGLFTWVVLWASMFILALMVATRIAQG